MLDLSSFWGLPSGGFMVRVTVTDMTQVELRSGRLEGPWTQAFEDAGLTRVSPDIAAGMLKVRRCRLTLSNPR
jgi:hypothetical protein